MNRGPLGLVLLSSLCSLCLCGESPGDDWPQWRGPDRSGVSKETGLLSPWPEKGPPLAWTCSDLGIGYSGPAVVGDRLYVLGTRGSVEQAFALDAGTGRILWSTEIGPTLQWKGNVWGEGPRSTPTVDGDRLYALSSQGELLCLETATGTRVWSRNLFKEFNGHLMDNNGKEVVGWGFSEGPLVDGNQVVVTPGGNGGLLLALDKKTGEPLWRSKEARSKAPYSSVMATEIGGIRQYVQLAEQGAVGVAAKDGKLLWTYSHPNDDLVIRTPIVHDGLVFVTYSFGSGSDLFRVKAEGGTFEPEKVFSNKNMKNEMGGVVRVGDHLYGYSDKTGWACQDFGKKGALVWEEKRKLGKGSVVCADGNLYCYTEDDGTVALLEASPKGYKEKGRFTIPKHTTLRALQGRIWTAPVVTNGRLYLRDQDLLFCYDVRGAKN
jgi:outer membrane protein assembly factor BamB